MWVSPGRSSCASLSDDPGLWIKCTDCARSSLCSIEENVQDLWKSGEGDAVLLFALRGGDAGRSPALYRKAICTKRDSVGFISINTGAFIVTDPCGSSKLTLDERNGLIWSDRVNLRSLWVCCCRRFGRSSRTERAAAGAVFSDD